MPANAYDARQYLRERLEARRPVPFVPIQCFGIPFNEYLPGAPFPGGLVRPTKQESDDRGSGHGGT